MRITAIQMGQGAPEFRDPSNKPLTELTGLSRVNLFVGPNNSGKSRLLRHICRDGKKNPVVAFAGAEADRLQEVFDKIRSSVAALFDKNHIASVGKCRRDELDALPSALRGQLQHDPIDDHMRYCENLASAPAQFGQAGGGYPLQNATVLHQEFRVAGRDASQSLKNWKDEHRFRKTAFVYIGVLRTLRQMDNDLFAEMVKRDYKVEASEEQGEVLTGWPLYNQIQHQLLGVPFERQRARDFERFLGEALFDGRDVTLMPRLEGPRVLHVKIGDEDEWPIYELGDGIQNAIIMTYPAFRNKQAFIFIEEPELFLHPGMQRKLLETFLDARLGDHTYFITTHSNHLLDMSMDFSDISIYAVRKSLEGGADAKKALIQVEQVSHGDSTVLQDLGVRASSVFLVNATIWVEGIIDRLYFRRYLELYQESRSAEEGFRRIEEDTHYVFVEYGGANITHWSWLDTGEDPTVDVERLCGQAMVISDRDGENKNVARKETLQERLNQRYYCLPVREVENLLPPEVIRAVVQEYEGKDVALNDGWGEKDYADEYLGAFIHGTVLKGEPARTGGYKDKSGTVKAKVTFCRKALPHITIDNMTENARDLAAKLYAFIKSKNE